MSGELKPGGRCQWQGCSEPRVVLTRWPNGAFAWHCLPHHEIVEASLAEAAPLPGVSAAELDGEPAPRDEERLRAAARRLSDATADWAATGRLHIDVMDDQSQAFLVALKGLRDALYAAPQPPSPASQGEER